MMKFRNRREWVEAHLAADEWIFDPEQERRDGWLELRRRMREGKYPVCPVCGGRIEFALSAREAAEKHTHGGYYCSKHQTHLMCLMEFARGPGYYTMPWLDDCHQELRVRESLLGTWAGDAFGQCFFGLPDDAAAMLLNDEAFPEGPWYYTDDTEMSLSIVACLRRFGRIDQPWLAQSFARHYHYDRAYGPAMHRALARIREGENWSVVSSSLFSGQGSFGNGAAMRSAPIGAFFAHEPAALVWNAALAAEITHSHPEAIAGAIAVAAAAGVLARMAPHHRQVTREEFFDQILALTPASEVRSRLMKARAIESAGSVAFPASVLGGGIEMSAQDTVPFALWCCGQSLCDLGRAIRLGVEGAVDRDTVGAIIGGVVACYTGPDRIPSAWRERMEPLPEWPFG